MNKMRKHSDLLVEQAELVSNELVRVSILWHEIWLEKLIELRIHLSERDSQASLDLLQSIYEFLQKVWL